MKSREISHGEYQKNEYDLEAYAEDCSSRDKARMPHLPKWYFSDAGKRELEYRRGLGESEPNRLWQAILSFIDWLNRLAGTEKPKRKTNSEQMATLNELFETDWDMLLNQARENHDEIMMDLQRLHAENMQDTRRDYNEELMDLKKRQNREALE